MIDFNFEKLCYSCTACSSVCPTKAISFDANLLPIVDNIECINCGLCEKECIKIQEKEYSPLLDGYAKGYVCKSIDYDIRKNSSSGGIFYHLAYSVIATGGLVCGCIYDADFMPKHILSDKVEDIKLMMGSKYVQSDLGNCLTEIKYALKNGRKVLFSGVPCQVAAVKAIAGTYEENLLLVGVVCHGSIDRKLWNSYLYQEKKNGEICSVTMRDKSRGWLNYGLKFKFKDGTEHVTYRKQDGYFLKCFTEGVLERERCLKCNYKGNRIFSDILLGDGWGMDKLFPQMVDQYGISSVICLTEKGKQFWGKIHNNIETNEVPVQTIIERNKRIISSPKENPDRKKFKRKYTADPESIVQLCEKFAVPSVLNRVKRKLKNIIH